MVTVVLDEQAALRDIRSRLGALEAKAPSILKNALDATARQARKELAGKAATVYAGHKKKDFTGAMEIQRPTQADLSAVIRAKSGMEELKSFSAKTTSKGVIKAKVLKASTLKEIIKGNIRAFGAQFSSGHETIAQRVGAARLPVKTLLGPSIPHMVGNEKVMGEDIQERTMAMLQEQINKRIITALEKGASA